MAVKRAAANIAEPEETPVKKEQDVEKVEKFSIEKLRQNSIALFGVTQSTFDGAMYGHKEKEFSIKEAKRIIDEWLYGKGGKR